MDKASYHGHWQEILSRYESSGLSQKAFCAANDIKYSQFKNYRYRHKHGISNERSRTKLTKVLMPIKVTPPSLLESSNPLTLLLPNGFQIKVSQPFDVASIKQLIEVVQSC